MALWIGLRSAFSLPHQIYKVYSIRSPEKKEKKNRLFLTSHRRNGPASRLLHLRLLLQLIQAVLQVLQRTIPKKRAKNGPQNGTGENNKSAGGGRNAVKKWLPGTGTWQKGEREQVEIEIDHEIENEVRERENTNKVRSQKYYHGIYQEPSTWHEVSENKLVSRSGSRSSLKLR